MRDPFPDPRRRQPDPLAVLMASQPMPHHARPAGPGAAGLAILHGTYGGAFKRQLADERPAD